MKEHPLLGDIPFERRAFEGVEEAIKACTGKEIRSQNAFQRLDHVCRELTHLIDQEQTPCFLLPHVIDFMERIEGAELLDPFHFAYYELWLNQHSGFSKEKNARIRGKICGRFLPRAEYQTLFPIGMGKVYNGTHIVTAHSSPDLDTIVASFWGWVDAFACRIGTGLHRWNVPGGKPSSIVELELLFDQVFGEKFFDYVAKRRSALSLSSLDLISQKGMIKKQPAERSYSIDHDRSASAVVLTDNQGAYIGDWRSIDVESVRDVVNSFNSLTRWVENALHIRVITILAKPSVTRKDFDEMLLKFLQTSVGECEPLEKLTMRQRIGLQKFLEDVLSVDAGLDSTLEHLLRTLEMGEYGEFCSFKEAFDVVENSGIFNKGGQLIADLPKIFSTLEKVVKILDRSFNELKQSMDSLHVALCIKKDVFGFSPSYLSVRTDIEEIRSKMGDYPSLTVNLADFDGKLLPLGVIYSGELQRAQLATVSLRDFCNRDETKIPPYFEVISVVDHHKASLGTQMPPRALISDAQSSNVLTAQLSFEINDRFYCLNEQAVDRQLKEIGTPQTTEQMRLFQRLLTQKLAHHNLGEHFISKERMMLEYLHYLYAIFDDTDLLTKMTHYDLYQVAALVNRLKSLQVGAEVEVVSFDEIAGDANFTKAAARALLTNPDLYSLYGKVFAARERAITSHFEKCASGCTSAVFVDTKVQNRCARVGQTKMFVANVTTFQKYCSEIRLVWLENAKQVYADRPDIDLHMQMISTIASAEELHQGKSVEYWHKDELWIWIPDLDLAEEHLKLFLSSFKTSTALEFDTLEVEFLGDNGKLLSRLFNESFVRVPHHFAKERGGLPIAVIKFRAGTLNSRKGHISPHVPKL